MDLVRGIVLTIIGAVIILAGASEVAEVGVIVLGSLFTITGIIFTILYILNKKTNKTEKE